MNGERRGWLVRAGRWQRRSSDYYRRPFPDEGQRPDFNGGVDISHRR